jgi:hypothetical protein
VGAIKCPICEQPVHRHVVTLDFPIPYQLVLDVLTIAVEGGINYWCVCEIVKRDDEFNVVAVIGAADAENPEVKFGVIDGTTVVEGIRRVFTIPKFNPTIRSYIIGAIVEGDSGMIDVEAADCIIQLGLFKELVYG